MSRLAILTMRPINKIRQRQPVQAQPAPVIPAPEPAVVVVAPEPVVALPEPEPEPVIVSEPEPVVVAPEPVVVAPEPEPEEAPAIELTREMLNTKTKAELVKFGTEIGLDLDASAKKSELVNKIAASIGI